MKKILYTTTAFILCGLAQSQAACIATPSCTTLGYTETSSCDGGLKCPFGNYWYCPSNSGGACSDFPYLCLGRGYLDGGGIGADCDGKYAKCTCYDGFEWQDGKGCVEITDCRIGSILYSDKTCSSSGYDDNHGIKTAIGVVVYSDGKGHGQALALKSLDTQYTWGENSKDISGLPNYSLSSAASQDFASCENSKIIMAAGDKNTYPAVWAANEYSTEGTKAGDWCLPAAGIFTSYYNNQEAINTGFSRANGTAFTSSTKAWASSEENYYEAWYSYFSFSDGLKGTDYAGYKTAILEVRPVLEF